MYVCRAFTCLTRVHRWLANLPAGTKGNPAHPFVAQLGPCLLRQDCPAGHVSSWIFVDLSPRAVEIGPFRRQPLVRDSALTAVEKEKPSGSCRLAGEPTGIGRPIPACESSNVTVLERGSRGNTMEMNRRERSANYRSSSSHQRSFVFRS